MYKNEEWVHFLITDYKGTYIYMYTKLFVKKQVQ